MRGLPKLSLSTPLRGVGRLRRTSGSISLAIAAMAAIAAAPTPTFAQEMPPAEPPPEARPVAQAPRAQTSDSSDDDPDASFYTSVNGPGAGKTQGLVGVGGIILRGPVGGPAFSLGLVYGCADIADFELRTDFGIITGQTVGLLGQVSPSLLLRVIGKRNMEGNFGLKFGPEILYAVAGGGVAIFGFTPGLAASFGTPKVQISMGTDFPIYFAVAGSATGAVTTASVRPNFAVEGNVSGSTNLFFKAGPLLVFDGGFAYVTILTGVTF